MNEYILHPCMDGNMLQYMWMWRRVWIVSLRSCFGPIQLLFLLHVLSLLLNPLYQKNLTLACSPQKIILGRMLSLCWNSIVYSWLRYWNLLHVCLLPVILLIVYKSWVFMHCLWCSNHSLQVPYCDVWQSCLHSPRQWTKSKDLVSFESYHPLLIINIWPGESQVVQLHYRYWCFLMLQYSERIGEIFFLTCPSQPLFICPLLL